MTSNTDIRRARPPDLDRIVAMHRMFCELDHHPFDDTRARAAFMPLLTDDTHGVVWVSDRPESYAVLTWGWSIEAGGPEAVLDEIFVSERGSGHGSSLIEHLVADAHERNIARIFLETESHNDRVRRFYERHGFVVDDSIWMSREFTDLS
jgi:ribosomal protein S18 acetylase RimI-like enzyme